MNENQDKTNPKVKNPKRRLIVLYEFSLSYVLFFTPPVKGKIMNFLESKDCRLSLSRSFPKGFNDSLLNSL